MYTGPDAEFKSGIALAMFLPAEALNFPRKPWALAGDPKATASGVLTGRDLLFCRVWDTGMP